MPLPPPSPPSLQCHCRQIELLNGKAVSGIRARIYIHIGLSVKRAASAVQFMLCIFALKFHEANGAASVRKTLIVCIYRNGRTAEKKNEKRTPFASRKLGECARMCQSIWNWAVRKRRQFASTGPGLFHSLLVLPLHPFANTSCNICGGTRSFRKWFNRVHTRSVSCESGDEWTNDNYSRSTTTSSSSRSKRWHSISLCEILFLLFVSYSFRFDSIRILSVWHA